MHVLMLCGLCLSVCVLVTRISPAKMAESIEMPFGGTLMCPQGTHCIRGNYIYALGGMLAWLSVYSKVHIFIYGPDDATATYCFLLQ